MDLQEVEALAALTAVIKLFIRRPTQAKELVPKILKWATEETENPDVRDRGYIYWRLLSADPVMAKAIVTAQQPPINTESDNLDPQLLNEVMIAFMQFFQMILIGFVVADEHGEPGVDPPKAAQEPVSQHSIAKCQWCQQCGRSVGRTCQFCLAVRRVHAAVPAKYQ